MTIIYNNNKENKIKLFGTDFIENNKDKCYIIIDNKKTELKEYIENIKQNKIEIKLYETGIITNMSYMFYGCNSLNSLPDISKWETKNVTNMNYMLSGCKFLESLPDISKWETKNVTNMGFMFNDCNKLNSLPDISKWDTKNVTDMSYMFSGCRSLKSFPDISKWDINENWFKKSVFENVKSKIIPKNVP